MAAIAAVGVGTAIPTRASASSQAPTQVSIIPESDGFYVYVSSPHTTQCANGRKVVLLKQLGTTQSPHTDQKIGFDTASPTATASCGTRATPAT